MDEEPTLLQGELRQRVPEDLAVGIDAQGVITAWSAGAERLLGYPPHEVVGRPAADLLADELPVAARQRLTDLTLAGWETNLALLDQDGHRVEVRVRAQPLVDADRKLQWFVTASPPAKPSAPRDAASAALWNWTLAQFPLPLAVYDRGPRLVGANEAMARMMGQTEDEMRGLRLAEIQPGNRYAEMDQLQEQALRTGEMVRQEVYGTSPGETRAHAWSMFFSPLKDEDGRVQGVSATVFDNTEQYWARRRLAILNEASIRIGSTLDVIRTAEELAEVAVGKFADFVTVDLLEKVARGEEPEPIASTEPVTFVRVAQQSVLPGCPESVVRQGGSDVYPPDSTPVQVLATGRGIRQSVQTPPMRRWASSTADRARTVNTFGIHSVMMVPLSARGTTMGVAHFLRHRTPDGFSADDLLLAEEITARAAVCVDNARRYTRERTTALALQRSLLPARPPRLAAVETASRYLPAGSQAGVGGDWFDVIPLSGARVALVVGDVVGHGVHASATMGRLRTAVRSLADVDLAPEELLTRLDDLVIRLDREEGPETREQTDRTAGEIGATCLYAVYDPVSRRCTVARAGHPAPAVVRPGGTVELLDLPAGPPLGLGGLPFEAADFELPEGSLLALYTNGLIDAADRDIDVGLAQLRFALSKAPTRPLEEICDIVLRTVLPDRPTDDVALLLARTSALDAGQVAVWDLPADPAIVAKARNDTSEQLAVWGLQEVSFVAELIVSELVTNAIRYGVPPIQLRLIRHSTLICEVSDGSNTAPHLRRARIFDEGGRGLLLVAQLAQSWGTRQTLVGKTIWAEHDLPDTGRG
jgi:PAS domain S-box-containing protein